MKRYSSSVNQLLVGAVAMLSLNLAPMCVHADDAIKSKPGPRQEYSGKHSSPVTYQVDFSAVVTPPYHAKVLKVWLPIPPSDSIQTVKNSKLTTFPMKVEPRIATEPVHGNTFAYFEFDHPQGAQIIRHRFTVTTNEVNWNLDPDKVAPVDSLPSSFAPYLRGEPLVPTEARFRKLAHLIVPQKSNALSDISAIMKWTNSNLTYDHGDCSLQGSAIHAIEKRRGHCSDYHGLCTALGRCLGYPTRIVYGINPFPKNSPSHCKLEVYLPPYGWVCFDVSETQKMIARIRKDGTLSSEEREQLINRAQQRLQKGFRDNTWFLQTRGSDYHLAPRAAKKASVVRTVYVEADGVALPEPDPSNPMQRTFSWMTVHDYQSDRPVTSPFADWKSLKN